MKGNAVIHYIKYLLGIDKPDTQTTLNERMAISKYAKNAQCCVEIGVYEGVNTATIAEAMDTVGMLYGIDPFFKGRLGVCYHEKIARHGISKIKAGKRVKLIPKFSFDAKTEVPDGIDFIFIDGDHSYEGFERDWKDWSVKMKTNGIIALHDTAIPQHDATVKDLGSYKYFTEKLRSGSGFELLETVDSLNILRKL